MFLYVSFSSVTSDNIILRVTRCIRLTLYRNSDQRLYEDTVAWSPSRPVRRVRRVIVMRGWLRELLHSFLE